MYNQCIKSLNTSRQTIALEDPISGNFSRMVNDVVPGILSTLKNVFSQYKKEDTGAIPDNVRISRKDTTFINLINSRSYMSINEITLFVPEGMCVRYSMYIQRLMDSVGVAEYTIKELDEYRLFISKLINDKNYQMSTDFIVSKVTEIKAAIDNDKKSMSGCFAKGKTTTTRKYKELFENNSEWVKVITDMENLTTRISKIDKRLINEKIETISVLVDVILKKINNGEMGNISPEIVSKIGEYTYIIALLLESFSVTHYRVMVLSTVIKDSMDKVTKIIKGEPL